MREAEEMLADFDKNKDGFISYKEFVQMLYSKKEEEDEKKKKPPPIQSDLWNHEMYRVSQKQTLFFSWTPCINN